MMNVLTALMSKDWRQRRRAVEELKQRETGELAHELLDIMRRRHEDLSLLSAALRILEENDRAPVPELVALLQDPDAGVRTYVPLVLGELRDPGTAPALISALTDENANVRFNAAEALGKMRSAAAVEPLVERLRQDTPFVGYAAVLALGEIGDARAVPAILPLLDEPYLAEAAVCALGMLGEPAVLADIVRWFERSPGDPWDVLEAAANLARRWAPGEAVREAFLDALGPRGREKILQAVRQLLQEDLAESTSRRPAMAAAVLGWMYWARPEDEDVRSTLIGLLAAPSTRQVVARALNDGPRPLPRELYDALDAPDREMALTAGQLLSNLDDPAGHTALISVLRSADEALAAYAAESLGRQRVTAAMEPLLAKVGQPAPGIRHAAIEALKALRPPGLASRLRALAASTNPYEREAAVKLIAEMGETRQDLSILLEALADASPAVRTAAVEGLPRFADPQIPSALADALSDPDSSLRAAAARALSGLPAETALPLLYKAARDMDGWVRMYACRSLEKHARPESFPYLADCLRDPSPPVRMAAARAMARLRHPEGTARLQALLEDENPEVRETARRILQSQTGERQDLE